MPTSKQKPASSPEKRPLLAPQVGAGRDKRQSRVSIEYEEEDDEDRNATMLLVSFVFMLFFALGNQIFGRLQAFPMHNYPLYVNMMSCVIYIPVCLIYVIPVMTLTDIITKEQTEIPKYKFAVMGLYDSISGVMCTFAINYITCSSTIVLVQQSAIPISMVISSLLLNSVYTKSQYIGATVVMFGIFLVLLPSFFSNSIPAEVSESTVTPKTSAATQLIWILVLVGSLVPMCLSSVYKEKALGETEIDVFYLNGWVGWFQFLFSIPLCIPSAQSISLPLNEIMPNLYAGMLCNFGINTVTEHHNPDSLPIDDCSLAPWFVFLYVSFNIIYNILIVVILKFGSSNILFIASTVIVPLSNVCFSLHFVPGHQPMRSMDVVGLVVIMVGLIIYRFSSNVMDLWRSISGKGVDQKEQQEGIMSRKLARRAERKQAKLYGWNQLEKLETFKDTRVFVEMRKSLHRSPQQIRGSLLYRLGIPPSPLVTMSRGSSVRSNRTGRVPRDSRSSSPQVPRGVTALSQIPKHSSLKSMDAIVPRTENSAGGLALSTYSQSFKGRSTSHERLQGNKPRFPFLAEQSRTVEVGGVGDSGTATTGALGIASREDLLSAEEKDVESARSVAYGSIEI